MWSGIGDGEDELAVGDVEADGAGDPVAGLADAALVAGRAEVAGLAGEGEEFLVAVVRAVEAGEAGGEVAAAVELLDDGDGVGAEGAVDRAVDGLVAGEEGLPGGLHDLPERGGAGTARAVDGGH